MNWTCPYSCSKESMYLVEYKNSDYYICGYCKKVYGQTYIQSDKSGLLIHIPSLIDMNYNKSDKQIVEEILEKYNNG